MITKKMKEVIENNPIAIGTISTDNKPNVSAAAYVKVIGKDTFVITNNFMNQTISNIKNNENISFIVRDKNWIGYKGNGKATYEENGKRKEFVKKMEENKGLPAKGAILVKVENIYEID